MDTSAAQFKTCSKLNIQVIVDPRHLDAFKAEYARRFGKEPKGFIPEKLKGTPAAFSIWYDGAAIVQQNLEMLGFPSSGFAKGDFNYCISGQHAERLFWILIRNGYTIGEQIPH